MEKCMTIYYLLKTLFWFLAINSVNFDQISKFFYWQIPTEIVRVAIIAIYTFSLIKLLHYLEKSENSKQLCFWNKSFIF